MLPEEDAVHKDHKTHQLIVTESPKHELGIITQVQCIDNCMYAHWFQSTKLYTVIKASKGTPLRSAYKMPGGDNLCAGRDVESSGVQLYRMHPADNSGVTKTIKLASL